MICKEKIIKEEMYGKQLVDTCGTEMVIKRSIFTGMQKGDKGETLLTYGNLYQCPSCKNIEII